jgi:hypothetical protein
MSDKQEGIKLTLKCEDGYLSLFDIDSGKMLDGIRALDVSYDSNQCDLISVKVELLLYGMDGQSIVQ